MSRRARDRDAARRPRRRPSPTPTQPPASSPSDRLRRSPPHARPYAAFSFLGSGSGRRFCAPTGALLQAPGARKLEVARTERTNVATGSIEVGAPQLNCSWRPGATLSAATRDSRWVSTNRSTRSGGKYHFQLNQRRSSRSCAITAAGWRAPAMMISSKAAGCPDQRVARARSGRIGRARSSGGGLVVHPREARLDG